MVFLGRFVPGSFEAFVRHRAGRLSIRADLLRVGPDRVEIGVEGDEDLVDMFEMACSLGPIDCLVVDSYREVLRR